MEPLGQTTLLEELLDGSDGKVLTGRFKGFAEQEKARGYIAHASIGPSCAVAAFENGRLTVWTHTQGVFPLRRELAKALKLDMEAVRCVHAEGSGCYGHNGADDVALDAALLARAVAGQPVRLQWMRDDEFAWEPYGAAMLARAKASLDASGKIVDWAYEVWSNTHSTRPAAPGDDNNLLASWYLAEPSQPGPPTNIPQPAGGGELVHERFDGKDVRVSAERAQRRDAQGHCGNQVVDHTLVGKTIERHRVAVAAACRLRNIHRRSRLARLSDIPAGQKIVIRAGCRGAGAVGIAPHLIDPVDDLAIRVE